MYKALVRLAESWFGMRSMRSQQVEGISADVFVYAGIPDIDWLLKHHGIRSQNAEVPIILMSGNAFESATLLANYRDHITNLGRMPEIISHP